MITIAIPNHVVMGRRTSGFLTRLLYQKYVLGLPVHRLVRMPVADDREMAQDSVVRAWTALAYLLAALEEATVARNAEAEHVHVTETLIGKGAL